MLGVLLKGIAELAFVHRIGPEIKILRIKHYIINFNINDFQFTFQFAEIGYSESEYQSYESLEPLSVIR